VGPARIKLYGFMTMTRRRYLLQLAVALGLAAVVVALWWWKWPEYRATAAVGESVALDRFVAVMNALPWIVLAAVALQLIEAFFVLRQFRRTEAAPPTPGA
jgi:hypothetical protein